MTAEAYFDAIAYINTPRWQQSRLGLARIIALLDKMGNPQHALRFVHVAGTNGKGSTCAYLANILQAAGLKTGLFTSPYILHFEERIRVNGVNISQDSLRDVTLLVKHHAEALAQETGDHPTEFELMTAVAFQYFAQCGCDIVVAEVGLGGRLDSTNVIDRPEVCVITRIGLDHTALLGETLAEVAGEKAGIIKQGVPVVSYPHDVGAMQVVEQVAQDCACLMRVPDFSQLTVEKVTQTNQDVVRPFSYKGTSYTSKLLGSYQPHNAALALEVIDVLNARGWHIAEEAVRKGIATTVWPGRFEVVPLKGVPAGQRLIIDGGHNPQGARVLAESLDDVFPHERPVCIVGVLADKNYRAMLEEIAPVASGFVCVAPNNPRALPAESLAEAVRQALAAMGNCQASVCVAASMQDALCCARTMAGQQGLVCAFGSLYQIAELKAALSVILYE